MKLLKNAHEWLAEPIEGGDNLGAGLRYTKSDEDGHRSATLDVYPDAYDGEGYVIWDTSEGGDTVDYNDGNLQDCSLEEYLEFLERFLAGGEPETSRGSY